jgi:hypothetical protein
VKQLTESFLNAAGEALSDAKGNLSINIFGRPRVSPISLSSMPPRL